MQGKLNFWSSPHIQCNSYKNRCTNLASFLHHSSLRHVTLATVLRPAQSPGISTLPPTGHRESNGGQLPSGWGIRSFLAANLASWEAGTLNGRKQVPVRLNLCVCYVVHTEWWVMVECICIGTRGGGMGGCVGTKRMISSWSSTDVSAPANQPAGFLIKHTHTNCTITWWRQLHHTHGQTHTHTHVIKIQSTKVKVHTYPGL